MTEDINRMGLLNQCHFQGQLILYMTSKRKPQKTCNWNPQPKRTVHKQHKQIKIKIFQHQKDSGARFSQFTSQMASSSESERQILSTKLEKFI